MNMHITQRTWSSRADWRRLLVTGFRSLELPGPGAVAHMSLHQKSTMSKSHSTKEADNNGSPICVPGDCCPIYVGDRSVGAGESRQRRVGEGHIWRVFESVNRLFAILFHAAVNRLETRAKWRKTAG